MKWTIVKKSIIQEMEKENKQLVDKIQTLEREEEERKERERKSENGEVVCGQYCCGCKHSYEKSYGLYGYEYGCKLLAKKECAHFEEKHETQEKTNGGCACGKT